MIIDTLLLKPTLKKTGALNIVYGADEGFMVGVGISILSIINNNGSNYIFSIFTKNMSKENINKFKELSSENDIEINIYNIDNRAADNLPTTESWNDSIYFRFIAADYIAKSTERFLYLDADTLCTGDISGLEKIDMKNNVICGVEDRSAENIIETDELFGTNIANNGYINSGVMLINSKLWIKKDITRKSMKILTIESKMKEIKYFDQDAINIVADSMILIIDDEFNFKVNLNDSYKNKTQKKIENKKIIHFVGPTKPWHEWSIKTIASLEFDKIKLNSPWRETPYEKAKNKTEFKYAAKHQKHKGLYLQSIQNYCKYLKLKLVTK